MCNKTKYACKRNVAIFFPKRTIVYYFTKPHDMFIGNIYIMNYRNGCAIVKKLTFINLYKIII